MTNDRLDPHQSLVGLESARWPVPAARNTRPSPRPAPASPAARPSTPSDPAGRSAQVLAYVAVMHALCDLDRVDRAALRLIYWHGCSQVQVAAELHLPITTVRAAVSRGMLQLADRLTNL